jgi:predicted ATP-grasp superfamily ATP-dependent carboligase
MPAGGALVIGGSYRALGVVRALGRRGIRVWVVTEPTDLLATTSKHVQRTLKWSDLDEQQRVQYLVTAAGEHELRGWVLIPTDDEGARLVARHYLRLASEYRVTTPPWETMRWAYDKRLTYELAQRVGVPIPWTLCPSSRDEVKAVQSRFPLILKPAFKENLNRLTTAKAWRVDDAASLLARYDEACRLMSPDLIMIQELVPGSGQTQFSYAALVDQGRPLAWLTARRVRQIPMDFGRFSTFVETVDEPAVIAPSERLLKAMAFTGLIEVEFKQDPRDRVHKLLDINPRVWGWFTLCARAGVDFTYLLWAMVHGQPVGQAAARPGVRWMQTSADVPMALKEILGGRLSPRDYLGSLRTPVEHAIFSGEDAVPALLEFPLALYKLGRRALSHA